MAHPVCRRPGATMPLHRRSLVLALGALTVVLPGTSRAQGFPDRPVRFVVAFPPGSTTDTVGRFYAERLSRRLSQAVIIDNRPGGNGFIGVAAMQAAPADGYTVLIGSTSTLATNAALFRRLPYDPVEDLEPITMMAGIPSMIVTAASGPYANLDALLTAARQRPGALNYGSGAASYVLTTELFNQLAGIRASNVPYRGGPDATTAVLSGQVDFAVADITSTLGLIQSGALRPLVIASDRRIPILPDVPAAPEVGLAGLDGLTWVGAAVSPRTPAVAKERLIAELTRIAEEPETTAFLGLRGAIPLPTGPAAMRQFQVRNIELWRGVAARAGVEPQ